MRRMAMLRDEYDNRMTKNMRKLSRITISLPTELLSKVQERLALEDENRSETFRRLIEQALKDAQEKADVAQYIQAYRDDPQTDDEFEWAEALLNENLKEVPWEPKRATG